MNTLVSFLIFITAVVINLFTIPIVAKIFSNSTNTALVSGMIILAAIDLSVRIIDLRGTKLEANERLVYPKCGGSFVFAPIWILAFIFAGYVIFAH